MENVSYPLSDKSNGKSGLLPIVNSLADEDIPNTVKLAVPMFSMVKLTGELEDPICIGPKS
jgi:hypothetical protein